MRLLALALLVFFGLAIPASAANVTCISTPDHLIASVPNSDVGESFAVYHKANQTEDLPCIFDFNAADLLFEGEYALEAVMGDYLVLSEGTSALRHLVMFDLRKGKTLVSVGADFVELLPTGLTYWERREMGTKQNCPQYEEYAGYGGGAVIAYRMTYDFHTGQARPSGDQRCDYLE